ncbi:FAD-dependent oxidoreductase [Meridianimarinicoccus roseus]|uniref:FAD-dependent oxidoreductase n=1 Tax=Meridianimarinicoccus roseus TaxID=2072018 RepID=A0A2V2LEI3_9RHOB|nr:FAD-binding oxidoreductase [Meridianimarinicoccus roseus]PWR01656.1 FAD-dependent oxidoreductase [Meridianimarinicoccus roseus]
MQETLWAESCSERVEAPPLDRSARVDLAIIGGGFTGCAAALEAARTGACVALLEAGEIGQGASGRNVGLVNAGLWLPPDTILAQMGAGPGRRLIDALACAPDRVFELISRHDIACEPVRAGTLHCAHAPGALPALADRLRQGNRLGAPLRLLDAAETAARTGTAAFHGALLDPRAGTVQPLAYCRGLARAAAQAGARLHGTTPVTALARDDAADGWRLEAGGHSLRARRVLLATNAYHGGMAAPLRPEFVTVRYSQFATAPLPPELRRSVLAGGEGAWDTALVMSSFRCDAQGRLVLGGMGDAAGPTGPVHRAWARGRLAALFPQLAEQPFAHVWSGRIAMTGDHLPRIVAFGPGALACFGYSGRGIAPGTVFGTAAARALLLDETDGLPVAPVLSHSEPLRRARAALFEAGASAMHALQVRPCRRSRGG